MADTDHCHQRGVDRVADTTQGPGRGGDSTADSALYPRTGGSACLTLNRVLRLEVDSIDDMVQSPEV